MKDPIYEWQGEPVAVTFGYCEVTEKKTSPLWWFNYEVLTHKLNTPVRIHAVRITYKGNQFAIANHYGIGVHKLLNGGGPNMPHASLPWFDFVADDKYKVERFHEIAYRAHEQARGIWQEKMYGHTDEFKRLKALKSMVEKKHHKVFENFIKNNMKQ